EAPVRQPGSAGRPDRPGGRRHADRIGSSGPVDLPRRLIGRVEMTAVFTPTNNEPIGQILTADEYDALPENRRRELVDGVIRMIASPNARHQYIASELRHVLDRLGRPRFRAIENIEVRLADRLRRIPDVIVVPAAFYDGARCR